MSVLVSTAYLDEAAMCHDVYIINKGVILAQGTPEALTEPYKNRVYFARADGRTSRQMLDLASHSSMILDSTPSGDGVRLLLKKDADLTEAAKELDIPELSPQPPRLEDAFMSLLIAADKPQKDFGENAGIENTKIDDGKPVILVENLVKKFGNFVAVDDTSLVLNAERYSDCSDRTVPAKLQLFVFYAVFFQQLRVRLKLQVSISEPPELLLGAQSVT